MGGNKVIWFPLSAELKPICCFKRVSSGYEEKHAHSAQGNYIWRRPRAPQSVVACILFVCFVFNHQRSQWPARKSICPEIRRLTFHFRLKLLEMNSIPSNEQSASPVYFCCACAQPHERVVTAEGRQLCETAINIQIMGSITFTSY